MHFCWNTKGAMKESVPPMYKRLIRSPKLLASLSHNIDFHKRGNQKETNWFLVSGV